MVCDRCCCFSFSAPSSSFRRMAVWFDKEPGKSAVDQFPNNYRLGEEYWLIRKLNKAKGHRFDATGARLAAEIVRRARARGAKEVVLVDFGCGLATSTNQLAFTLLHEVPDPLPVSVFFIDTFKAATANLLMCLCSSIGARCSFLPVNNINTVLGPALGLPHVDFLIAEEVLPVVILQRTFVDWKCSATQPKAWFSFPRIALR